MPPDPGSTPVGSSSQKEIVLLGTIEAFAATAVSQSRQHWVQESSKGHLPSKSFCGALQRSGGLPNGKTVYILNLCFTYLNYFCAVVYLIDYTTCERVDAYPDVHISWTK